jgi:hypothetical protein
MQVQGPDLCRYLDITLASLLPGDVVHVTLGGPVEGLAKVGGIRRLYGICSH